MAAFNGNAVSISSAQRDTRISRLLHTFEACQSTLDQLRDLPEVTAVLDSFDSSVTCNESMRRSDDATVCEQTDAISCQNRKPKAEEAIQDIPTCIEATLAGSNETGDDDDPSSPVSDTQEPASWEHLTSTETDSCGTSKFETRETSETRRKVGAVHHWFVGQNQHSFQETTSESSKDRTSIMTTTQQSSHLDQVDHITGIRIVRVESLSVLGKTVPSLDTVIEPVAAAIQPVVTAVPSVDLDTSFLPQSMMFTVGTIPGNSIRRTITTPYPDSTPSNPSLYQGMKQMGSVYSNNQAHPIPPLLHYVPSQMNGGWLDMCDAQQAASPYLTLPTAFRPSMSTLKSRSTIDTQRFGNLCPPTETSRPANWKNGLSGSLTHELALKIVSYGSVRTSSYENELYLNRQALPLAKRPRYEAYAVN